MNATRRNFLKFFGGATAGAMLSPLPWKLLDDVSIWTQNWSWTPRPPRGPVSWRTTTCTFCPAGCGLNVRCIGGHPVSAWAIAGHPLSAGTACPAGFAAAQLGYHPARIRGAVTRGRGPTDKWKLADANGIAERTGRLVARIRERGDGARIAVLDPRPGRALSLQYRQFLEAAGGGQYLTLPDSREQAASALDDLLDLGGLEPAWDLEQAGAVISFGAPVFDGWRGAAPAPGLLSASERPLFTVQVSTNGSRDTDQADLWLPVRPGAEAALAIGLARMIREMNGGARPAHADGAFVAVWDEQLAAHTPEKTAAATGIGADQLRRAARELVAHAPAVALGGGNAAAGGLGRGEELAVWGLNLELGAVGRAGGVLLRPGTEATFGEAAAAAGAAPRSLADVPDGSLDLLLVDGSLPGAPVPFGLLRRKMRGEQAQIVALSAFAAGPSAEADAILPAAAPGEWLDDVPARALAGRNSYALSPAVFRSPVPALHPADALAMIAAAAGIAGEAGDGRAAHEAILARRLDALLAAGSGDVFTGSDTKNLAAYSSRRKLEKALARGGCWTRKPGETAAPAWSLRDAAAARTELVAAAAGRLPETVPSRPLAVVAAGPAVAIGGGALPPALTKLYRESNLMSGAGLARVNPATARERALREGANARLETERGTANVVISLDESVMPGVVAVAPGPDPLNLGDPESLGGEILEICGAADRPVWRVTAAALREV